MYRAGLESILGFTVQGNILRLDPCIPKTWRNFEIVFRHRSSRFDISVENPNGVCRGISRLELDERTLPSGSTGITLVDDGETHRLRVLLG
jgi:cyclic beta-1,2-glucan synthetase